MRGKIFHAPLLAAVLGLAGCNNRATPPPQPAEPAPTSMGSASSTARSTISEASPPSVRERGYHPRAAKGSAPGQFDFYLFTLSWSPEYCSTNPQSPECSKHLGFIVHGLWPQNTNGTYPEDCSNQPGPTNPASWTDIFPDVGLIAHEWQTHGTCSGLAADAYFGLARKAFHEVVMPTTITSLRTATSLPPAQIINDFVRSNPTFPQSSFVVSCGNNYLTAVEVCMSKSLQPITCSAVKTCRANTVKITPESAGN